MVLVRHPLGRLVSAYHSKFVVMGFGKWNKVLVFEKKKWGGENQLTYGGKIRFFLSKVRQAIIMFFRDGGFGFVRSEDEQFAGAVFENPEDDPRLPT